MIKILYWNIKQFSINKINQPQMIISKKRKKIGGGTVLPVPTQESTDRKQYIIDTFSAQLPDIFVVVEVSTGKKRQGTLISSTGGQQGSLDLLLAIRTATANNAWMLVPPLVLGSGTLSEGISVYFNSARLTFTGPYGWPGNPAVGQGYPAVEVAGNTLIAYSGAWANTLPTTLTPTTAGIINPGKAQNLLAGQWAFKRPLAPTKRLQFPGSSDRSPFLTTFWDSVANRNIKLLTYHAPPGAASAAKGTKQLANIAEMTTSLTTQDVGVMVGDFNVNLFNTVYEPIAYTNLVETVTNGGAGYIRQVNPTTNATFPEMAYVCTTLKALFDTRKKRNIGAAPWDTNGYPGYSYITGNSYDNFLTRYGTAAGGPAQNITIVNRVTGAPYNKITPVPGGAPTGSLAYTTAMGGGTGLGGPLPLPPPAPGGYPANQAGCKTNLRTWANFGKIRNTSDHLPLIIEV